MDSGDGVSLMAVKTSTDQCNTVQHDVACYCGYPTLKGTVVEGLPKR